MIMYGEECGQNGNDKIVRTLAKSFSNADCKVCIKESWYEAQSLVLG